MNDPFEAHEIEHLSPASINAFVTNKPMWIMRYLFKYRDGGGPAMWRGTAVDHAVGSLYSADNKAASITDAMALAEQEFDNQKEICNNHYPDTIIDQVKLEKEQANLDLFAKEALSFYTRLGAPTEYQKTVYLDLESIPVPIKGIVDLQYGSIVRDIKTTMRLPSKVPATHARQLAIYAAATQSDHAYADYVVVTSRTRDVVSRPIENIKDRLSEAESIALAITRLLSVSNDKHEIAGLCFPDFESWMWGDTEKEFAKTIWRIK